jgi:hypothetical protein
MSRPTPTCGKCETRHWNFQPCNTAELERRGPKQPPIESAEEGFRPWGDRFDHDYVNRGGTLWLKDDAA